MSIVRNTWRGIILFGILTVAVTAAFISVMAARLVPYRLGDVVVVGFALCIVWFFYVGVSYFRMMHARQIEAYVQGDHTDAFPVALPPKAEPLAIGETLKLEVKVERKLRWLEGFLIFCLIIGLLAFLAFSSAPSIFDHYAIVVIAVYLSILQLLGGIQRIHSQTIILDDAGLSIQKEQDFQRVLRWDEIVGVVRDMPRDDAAHSDYSLLTRTERFQLDLYIRSTIFGELLSKGVQYMDDPDDYQMRVGRLLATLATRSAPLVEMGFRFRGKVSRSSQFTIEDAAALPIAPAHLQPETTGYVPLQNTDLPIAFSAIRDWGRIWRNGLVGAMFITAVLGGLSAIGVLSAYSISAIVFNPQFVYGFLGLMFGIGLLISLPSARSSFRNRYPSFLIQEDGLALNYCNINKLPTGVVVPWAAFGAWTVEEWRDGRKGYALYTPSKVLSWMDDGQRSLQGRGVVGDRQAAYREKLAQMYAIISERTGLVLREERHEER